MSNETKEATAPIVKFNVTDAAIAKMEGEYLPLKIKGLDDKGGLASVHEARMVVKGKRVDVEKTRKELKADALAWGKKVDAEANRIKSRLQPIEDHLAKEENRVKASKAKIKAEAEAEEQERLQSRVDLLQRFGRSVSIVNLKAMTAEEFQVVYEEAKVKHEAEQARLAKEAEEIAAQEEADRKEMEAREEVERVEREAKEEENRKALEAEEARLAEQRTEQDRVAKEQGAKAEELRIEKERIAKEQAVKGAEIQAENDRLEAERQAIENDKLIEAAKKEAAEQATRETEEKVKREAEEKAEAEREAREEEARQEALKPDKEKLWNYVLALSNLPAPELKTKEAKAILAKAKNVLLDLAEVVKGSIEKM